MFLGPLHTKVFLIGFQVFASFFIAYLGCKMMQKHENVKTQKPDFFATKTMIQWKNDAKTRKHV